MTIKTIYIFGNPLLNIDNLPLKISTKLQKSFPEIKFKIIDPNENLHPENGELIIIDTIIGINDVTILNNINYLDKIENNPNYSTHDFDLGFNLKILKKIGLLKKIIIIGIPSQGRQNEIFKKIKKIIFNLLK